MSRTLDLDLYIASPQSAIMQRIASIFIFVSYLMLGTYAVPAMRWSIGGVDVPYSVPILAVAVVFAVSDYGVVAFLRKPFVAWSILLFLFGTITASLASGSSAQVDVLKAMLFPLGLVGVMATVSSAAQAGAVIVALGVSAFGVFLYGVYGYLTWNVGDHIEHTYNYFAVTYKPSTRNGDQLYFLVAAAILVSALLSRESRFKSKPVKVFCFAALVSVVGGITLSYSRGAWITAAVMLTAAASTAAAGQKGTIVKGMLITMLTLATATALVLLVQSVRQDIDVVDAVKVRFASIYSLDDQAGANSNIHRVALLKQALEIIISKPWGIGIGNAGAVLVVDGGGFGNHAENSYVQVFLERGFIAFSAFVVLTFGALRQSWRAAKAGSAGFVARSTFLVCLVIVLYGFFNNLTDSAWYWLSLAASTSALPYLAHPRARDARVGSAKYSRRFRTVKTENIALT